MKKFFILIASLMLLVVLGLVAGYLFREPLLQRAGPYIAENYGLDVVELDVGQINLQQIIIPNFKGSYFDQGGRVDIAVENLIIQIDPWVGVQGAIKDVRVDNLLFAVDLFNQVFKEADSS